MNVLPASFFAPIYYNFLLLLVLIACVKLLVQKKVPTDNIRSYIVVFGLIVFMGIRPVSGHYFGDMGRYVRCFNEYSLGIYSNKSPDIGFFWFTRMLSSFVSDRVYIFFCAFLYIFILFIALKKIDNKYWYILFLSIIAGISFWGAGVNGIRTGLASSFVLLGFVRHSKKKYVLALLYFIIGASFHKSLLLPIVAWYVAMGYTNSTRLLQIWLVVLILSVFIGEKFTGIFELLNMADRANSYLNKDIDKAEFGDMKAGYFRWDFLFYSIIPVIIGWYAVIRKKMNDNFYSHLFNTYLIANAFWVMIIRVNFSNRFAYLSWFFMGILIVLPFFKEDVFKKRENYLAFVLMFFYAFTYLINVML
tara:strand:- start:231 stop:1316 length:1086 start_codon:yes stop_codon:yes gene_type:complete